MNAESNLGITHWKLAPEPSYQDLAMGSFSQHAFTIGRSETGLLASDYVLMDSLLDSKTL